jgi:hypothetical protein
MQVVRRTVGRSQRQRAGGIPHDRVEVNDGVEGSAGADPLVHRLPRRLSLRSVEVGALERQQRGADDPQALGMRPLDQLLIPGDELLRAGIGRRAQVVDPDLHDDVPDAGLAEDVGIEPGQPAGAVRGAGEQVAPLDASLATDSVGPGRELSRRARSSG